MSSFVPKDSDTCDIRDETHSFYLLSIPDGAQLNLFCRHGLVREVSPSKTRAENTFIADCRVYARHACVNKVRTCSRIPRRVLIFMLGCPGDFDVVYILACVRPLVMVFKCVPPPLAHSGIKVGLKHSRFEKGRIGCRPLHMLAQKCLCSEFEGILRLLSASISLLSLFI